MYYDQLSNLGIRLRRRSGSEKTTCPKCSESRRNKKDPCLSVNITNGEFNCHNCFSGETRVITYDGVFEIKDILGKVVKVLDGKGNWVETVYKSYGVQELMKITITRNGIEKDIYSTANHRWFARGKVKELYTKDLLKGQRLISVYPDRVLISNISDESIQHGFVFGDGAFENNKRNTRAYFCGEKDLHLSKYFPQLNPVYRYTDRVIIGNLPKEYKSFPSLQEKDNYLFGWLSGYFAADGDVCENGMPHINSSKKENLEYIRNICNKLGIGTFSIKKYSRNGYGGISDIYRLSFLSSTLPSFFFLQPEHKRRFENFNKKYERKRWLIKSVEKTNRIENVYCCEVDTTNSFALEDNILTGNCGWKGNVRFTEKKQEIKKYIKPDQQQLKQIELTDKIIAYAANRKITKQTLDKFMVFAKEEYMPQTQKKERCVCFPYIRESELINVKFRDGAKNFKLVKDGELIFFGMQTLQGRHSAIITEGEWDALSAYEAGFANEYALEPDEHGEIVEHPLGMWAVLSVPNGASKGSQRLEYLDNCSDWIKEIDEFIIATDGDEAGITLKDELIRRLGVEKCRYVTYPNDCVVPTDNGKRKCKDLNEVLIYLGKEKLIEIVTQSVAIPVDGIYYLEDIFESMLENFKKGIQLAPSTRFKAVDEYFRWKKGDINLFSGYANYGKTTFLIQLMLIKSIYDGWKWAIFSPENYPANDFYDDIVEMYVGKWLTRMSEDEYINACEFINKHFFYVYPDNEHSIESIHEKFRYLVLKKGVDGVVIDPFNQLDKNQKPYERDDQYLSEVLKDIKRFALLNAVVYNIVCHPKNPTYEKNKALPPVGMYDLHGGSMWGNKADSITIYHRPKFHEDKNSPDVEIHQIKTKRKRTGGQNGEYPLQLLWSQKRFCDPITHEIPCDPLLAQRLKLGEPSINNNSPKEYDNWLPYSDTDAPF